MEINKLRAKFARYRIREKVIRAARDYFHRQNFHEVETPLLVDSVIPESYLESFKTILLTRNRKKKPMFLTTSPEASLKKLVAAGLGNCFEITKSFRNTETDSHLHNPEFTILEWYRVPSSYTDIMKDCEELILHIHQTLFSGKSEHKPTITYQGKKIDISSPWPKLSVAEALKKYAHISINDITNRNKKRQTEVFSTDKISKVAHKKGYKVEDVFTWEQIFNQIFLNEVEGHLGTHGKPTILYDYPRPLAAIAKISPHDPRTAQRFEFYIAGLEMGDGYNESTDKNYLAMRYRQELESIKRMGKTKVKADEEFLEAMSHLKTPYSGIAVGMDRLCMFFADATSINDVLLFPVEPS